MDVAERLALVERAYATNEAIRDDPSYPDDIREMNAGIAANKEAALAAVRADQ